MKKIISLLLAVLLTLVMAVEISVTALAAQVDEVPVGYTLSIDPQPHEDPSFTVECWGNPAGRELMSATVSNNETFSYYIVPICRKTFGDDKYEYFTEYGVCLEDDRENLYLILCCYDTKDALIEYVNEAAEYYDSTAAVISGIMARCCGYPLPQDTLERCHLYGSTFSPLPGGSGNGGSGNGGSGNDDTPLVTSCDHDFQWQTITSATATTYGTEGDVCSKCGATRNVRTKSPLDDWVRMQINNAKPGDVLKLNFGPWNSYPLWMMQMIADKPTVTYIFNYTYQGNKYEVTIKPGDKFALDCKWYGPAKMPTLFDTVITKW